MSTLTLIRRWLLVILLVELSGTLVELLLLEHYAEPFQWIPLVLIVLALVVILWHAASAGPVNTRALQILMALMVVAGMTGVTLHLKGASEYLHEMDPTQSNWEVLKKSLKAQAPPALAPGVMLQMGLLGLVYAYRHPSEMTDDSVSLRTETQA